VSPIAFEDLSGKYDLPNGRQENINLALYTNAMKQIAEKNNVYFVDAYAPSKKWYEATDAPLTIDWFATERCRVCENLQACWQNNYLVKRH
jgi:hypothetical protein